MYNQKNFRVNLPDNFLRMDFERLASELVDQHWSIVDDVLPLDSLNVLRDEAMLDYDQGEFRAARVGKGLEKQRINELRSDKIRWLDRVAASQAQERYWEMVDMLRLRLAQFFRIHLERTELHFAVYPEGAFYAPHLDQFREQSDRIFSVITYLNPNWQEGHGGELRIHLPNGGTMDVAPLHGRMVVFRSDQVLHEVMLATEMRISITGWMRRDPLIY